MTLSTRSQFLTVDNVDADNFRLDFNEGSGEITAEVDLGGHSASQLMTEVASAMNTIGTQVYTVTLDRATRLVTISASSSFDLLVSSGSSSATSIFTLLGFTGADRTSATSYEGDTAIGTLYRPQFRLQDYTPFENFKEASEARVNRSASGQVEVLSFGSVQFSEFNITNVTDRPQRKNAAIENAPTAVADLRSFLSFAITKSNFEFMEDRGDPDTFNVVLLESIRGSRDGTGFQMRELVSRGLNGYFETGTLRLRKIS